jgi:ketosteroid isomerase-like protein
VRPSEVVRRQFAELARGDFDAAAALWHPDVTWRAVVGAPDDVGVIEGREPLRRYYEDWMATLDDMRAEVDDVVLETHHECVLGLRNEGRARGSDALVRGHYFVVCTVRDGRLVRGREYGGREEALAAVGQRADG